MSKSKFEKLCDILIEQTKAGRLEWYIESRPYTAVPYEITLVNSTTIGVDGGGVYEVIIDGVLVGKSQALARVISAYMERRENDKIGAARLAPLFDQAFSGLAQNRG